MKATLRSLRKGFYGSEIDLIQDREYQEIALENIEKIVKDFVEKGTPWIMIISGGAKYKTTMTGLENGKIRIENEVIG